jgi:regulator of protease activity HflC (stomatin/prohibitin superfamily)
VEILNTSDEFTVKGIDMSVFLKDEKVNKILSVVDIKDQTLVLHYVNGKFEECIKEGRHAFFNIYDKHEFVEVDISTPEVKEDFPMHLFASMPTRYFYKVEVSSYEKARLYFDMKLIKLLDEGTHYFWNNGTRIEAQIVDTRLMQMDITGQEILTLDKVALRINFTCKYKIKDYVKIHTEIDDFEKQMHITLQLALREYVGKQRLDEILENKEEISRLTFRKLKENETEYFIEVFDAGIKDIILPGEIRDIMNTVLVAEKKAQANVITRREEVASTRSLLNTAKLMEENQTLYKLKELEFLEKICDNVGSINVGAGADLLSQLSKIVKG